MADYTYLDGVIAGSGNRRHFSTDQSPDLELANANSMELLVQQQINQQLLLSPTIPQRHDSLFQCSPSTTPRPSLSQHQAEAQAYALASMTPHTTNGYLQRPVNMSRSASQYSSTSSGHYQRYNNQPRVSRGSFGNASPPMAPDMSRSASQYSASSTAQQAAPQPSVTQPHIDTTNHLPIRPSNIPSNLPSTNSPANLRADQNLKYLPDPIFEFDVNDIMGGTLGGEESGNKMIGPETTTNV
ncbi:uncharacterized protein K460DRAFT_72313 [Cucurbitaria berberidis CBS 394.84]|uniref:Uncharacterized protein n=1 Tax=Cucurbitaria berberidis CBS 394.84 TaxID=1168544 RepID=A0A9P4GML1_9PLEO|nr:uncharacterized protein K460DRAFT_72313 [Cucurbitaria berberidis CBS 394.84]KAF1848355.1 hypothetical protein K460DRAFT_72313 [Cucurbitaria berberidis CBS 394.84]